jgi:TonB family protein
MSMRLHALPIALAALMPAGPAAAQPDLEFRLIQHWDQREDGARTTTERDTLQLRTGSIRTRTIHTDFVLRFDYRLLKRGSGGALLVRAGIDEGRSRAFRVALDDGPARGSLSGVDRTLHDVTHDAPAAAPARDGWMACEVRAVSDTLAVTIDGRAVAWARVVSERPGYIAFEAGRGGLDLRGMRIALLGADAGAFARGVAAPIGHDVFAPTLTARAAPIYPSTAMRAGVTGVALLEVVVKADGTPGEMRVLEAPHPDLALAAIDCVRKWRFKPATKAGVPLPFLVTVEVAFNLGNKR